ncbi:protein AMBP [Takifugu flavidus]|uniref:protein AMBP n=1 Tax=Takifugu flavidus TaxID=433684 RepID=UPI002544B58E|nr:protein AMBP [Takifugu flavidus]
MATQDNTRMMVICRWTQKGCSMWRTLGALLLVLVSAWTLRAEPLDPEPVIQTQENFDLGKFMGKWYQVAAVSTCPCYMKRKSRNPEMFPVVLQHVGSELNFTKTATIFRNGTCKQMTSRYSLTNTPGRFFHHVSRFGADVDSFVVGTNYEEYAAMLQLSRDQRSGEKSTNILLYSRTMNVTSALLDDFKQLVEEHGISGDTIIINQNNGTEEKNRRECVPEGAVYRSLPPGSLIKLKRGCRTEFLFLEFSISDFRMQKAASLVSLLVLGFSWTLQGLPVLPEPLYTTQENFDMEQFLGTWYDVVVATAFPLLKGFSKDGSISKLELQRGASESKLKAARTVQIHGMCRMMSGEYEITGPGRYYYNIPVWNLSMESYVIHTNYKEYAVVMMRPLKAPEEELVTVRLFSRTKTVRDSLVEDVKALARQHGISEENIFIKQDRGDCVPGEPVEDPTTQPEPQRRKRNVVAALNLDDSESSGMDPSFFNGTEACRAAPDTGPCFGFFQHYFYNSSSMSCELFNYGGCLGNQNNFKTERECLQSCRTEAVCRLPMSPKPCSGQPPIWAFDSSAGLCVPYKVDFCQNNANKFYSKAECQEYCGKTEEDDTEFLAAN